ncbi:MAG: branched-chain amino acid ABC transporter permease [Candidatus Thorarchaeota archaeon]
MISKNKISKNMSESYRYVRTWVSTFSGSLTLFCLVILTVLPFFSKDLEYTHYFLPQFILAFIFAIFAASWDLITGIAGQINFGQAMFFGIGGFITGALLVDNPGISVHYSIIMGVIVAAILGLIIGIPSLKLKGPYLMLVTLVFNIILLKLMAMSTLSFIFRGNLGVFDIPKLSKNPIVEYYILFISTIIIFVFLIQLSRSKFGTVLKSIRDDEMGADASGINTTRYKLIAFMLSAMIASIAGIFYALHYQTVNPSGNFSMGISFTAILMASLGGIGTIKGSAVGAFFFIFLEYILLELGFELNLVRILFAIILLCVVRFASRGILAPILENLKDLWDLLLGR